MTAALRAWAEVTESWRAGPATLTLAGGSENRYLRLREGRGNEHDPPNRIWAGRTSFNHDLISFEGLPLLPWANCQSRIRPRSMRSEHHWLTSDTITIRHAPVGPSTGQAIFIFENRRCWLLAEGEILVPGSDSIGPHRSRAGRAGWALYSAFRVARPWKP